MVYREESKIPKYLTTTLTPSSTSVFTLKPAAQVSTNMPPSANLNGEHTPHPNHHQNHHQNHQHNHQNHHSQQPHHHQNHSRPPYHHHSHSSSSSASFKGCCCCLLLLLTFLGLLVLAIILVIFLALKPKKPQFELQQVNVEYVGITSTAQVDNPSAASLSLTIRMVFKAVNPNKVGIKYSLMEFHVMYRGVPLGVASVPGFYQPANSVRQIDTTVSVDRVSMMQYDAVNLIKDATLNDRVELKVFGDVGAKIKILDITSPKVKVSLNCAIVISPRRQMLTYKQCGVDGLTV